MPTRPPSPDPTGADQADPQNPFATLGAGLGAGLNFFQDWIKAAGSALPNMPGAQPGAAPGLSAWSMPTLDPEELEKRIQDLKTVQFWLEQNARMVAMTIQGLEVQRMTLSTLKGMNVSMDALRDSLKARAGGAPFSSPSPAAAPEPSAETARSGSDDRPAASADDSPKADAADASELINPMRWWDTLTQQFTHLASQAAQTVNDSVGESVDILKQAQSKAARAAADEVASRKAKGTATAGTKPKVSRKAAPRSRAKAAGTKSAADKASDA